MRSWYAAYTRPRCEKRISELLTQQGFENYLPLIKSIRQWSDRKKTVELPLFSSYIFVRIDTKEYHKAVKINGIVRFITFDKKLVTVPGCQIEAIKKYIETGEEFIADESSFTIGKRVRVSRGGMKGLQGRLVEVLGKQRVKVEIESIQKSLFLKIPLGSLEIIGDAEDTEVRYW